MENTQKPVQSGEIDLGQLFTKIGDSLINIGIVIMRFIAMVRRIPIENKMLFGGLIILGLIIGYSYSAFVKRKFYESTMILTSNYLNKRIVENSIAKLNLLSSESTPKGLARILSIPDSLADKIVNFESRPFVAESDLIELEVLKEQLKNAKIEKNEKVIDQVISRIEIENRHAFEIKIRTFTPTAIKPLQEALMNYFRNNEYVKKRIEITKINRLAKKDKLLRESMKLDSLKFVIYANYNAMAQQGRQGSNNVILSDKAVTNPIEVYTQDLSIYNQLQEIEFELYIQPDFELIDGSTEFSEPASAGRIKILLVSIIISIGFSYLLVILIQFNRYLANFN